MGEFSGTQSGHDVRMVTEHIPHHPVCGAPAIGNDSITRLAFVADGSTMPATAAVRQQMEQLLVAERHGWRAGSAAQWTANRGLPNRIA